MELKNYIRSVKDFPKQGIDFKDISPLLGDSKALNYTIDKLAEMYSAENIDKIGAFDARGFLFGPAVAYMMEIPFFQLRKAGKLPYSTVQKSYGLEYGSDTIEVHTDAIQEGERVLLIDDLLATGGTMKAGCELIGTLEGTVVGCGFVIELAELGGRKVLQDYDVQSLLQY